MWLQRWRAEAPEAVFVQVAEEVGRLLDADAATIQRYEPDGHGTVVGNWGKLGDAFHDRQPLEAGWGQCQRVGLSDRAAGARR